MAAQLALFPGMVGMEPADTTETPVAPEPAAPAAPATAPVSRSQMGLFDAQVRRLRAAIDAVALADLPTAMSLLEGLTPGLQPDVPLMRQRVVELHVALERIGALAAAAQVEAHLALGRSLASEGAPWSSLGRTLVGRAAAGLGEAEGALAARLFMEAGELERARSALLATPGPPQAATLFTLGDVELAREDRAACRRHYRDALLLDPFDPAFEDVADEDVRGLPYLAEFEVEVDGEPRAWCAPVGIVAGILPRPREGTGQLPMPMHIPADRLATLTRAREFVDALVQAAAPELQKSRDALLETRRRMKRASPPLFAWYMARQVGASGAS
jgi:hypothetical protein